MKNFYYFISLFGLLFIVACGDDNSTNVSPIDVPEATIDGSTFDVLQGYENAADGFTTLKPGNLNDPIYIQDGQLVGGSYHFAADNASRLDGMAAQPGENSWTATAAIVESKCYWVRHTSSLLYTYLKLRIAYIEGNNVGVEYIIDSTEERDPTAENANANLPVEGQVFVTDYAVPHLNSENTYVEHTVDHNNAQVLNYALEWNAEKRHAAWIAFSFDDVTKQNTTGRNEEWAADPLVPEGTCPTEADHKSDGFDKGHLCASNDRKFSAEANEQTYYYSNMSPMMSSFNGGFWASFEILVQNWGRSDTYDKVYVTKGGTLDQLLINYTGVKAGNDGVIPKTDENGFTIHGLACPKYYFMAVLTEHEGEYHAIGFWMEHRDDYGYEYDEFAPSDVMKKYAVSIDELEKNTGLDFFCNLPDTMEDEVESAWSEADWAW